MKEDTQITKIIASRSFRIFLGALLLALIIFSMFWCNINPQPLINPVDPLGKLEEIVKDKEAVILAAKERNQVLTDSLNLLLNKKPKYIRGRDRVRDSLIFVADTACVRSLVALYDQCAKVDSVNEFIIGNQSNQIANLITVTNNQQDIIDIRNYQHGVDSINEISYKEQIQTEIKNGRKKYRKGLIQGGAIGIGTGAILGLIAR